MESIVLENGIEYLIVKTNSIEGIDYTLFANINDNSDICFRKTVIENDEEFYVGLDNEEEFNKVVSYFAKDYLS